MDQKFIRTEMILGKKAMERLKQSTVAIFGIGGVGSFTAEALARSGVGKILLVDHDKISISNLNRQIHAAYDTIGQYKVDVMKQRILKINPEAQVETKTTFFLPGKNNIIPEGCNYIVDAIDTVTAKIELVLEAEKRNIPILSSMGTGNKLDPTKLEIADIYETSVCPLAKVMRKELKKRGIAKLKVVYSKEEPIPCKITEEELETLKEGAGKRQTPGSVAFVPSVAGLIIAGEVIKTIAEVSYG